MAAISSFDFTKIMTKNMVETLVSNVERSDMDSGPVKQVPKSSKGMVNVPVRYLLTSAQYTTYKTTWYPTTSKYGSLWFNFVDPRTNATVVARIVGGSGAATPVDLAMTYYWLDLNLEMMV